MSFCVRYKIERLQQNESIQLISTVFRQLETYNQLQWLATNCCLMVFGTTRKMFGILLTVHKCCLKQFHIPSFPNSETIGVLTSNMGRVECLFGAGLLVPLQVARCRCKVPLQGLAAKCHCKVPQVKVRCPLGSRVVVPFRGTTGLDLLLSGVYAGIFFFWGGGNNIFWTCSHASDPPLYLQVHSSVSVASTYIG